MPDEIATYGYEALKGIPEHMGPWSVGLQRPIILPDEDFGEYVLVEVEPATIEQAHQAEVMDEDGYPLRGIWVVFSYHTGPALPLEGMTKENYWRGGPADMHGQAIKTNGAGYAEHTTGEGGEWCWVWDIEKDGILRLPSVIVKSMDSIDATEFGGNLHHGVQLTFQRRKVDVVPRHLRFQEIEERVKKLEDEVAALTG